MSNLQDYSTGTCIFFPCRLLRGRHMKSCFFRCVVFFCVCFLCWNLLGLMPPGDWSTFYGVEVEADESWIVNNSAKEQAVAACSLRHTIKKEGSLRKQFNFLVPVLQWRDSFNAAHWQKLQSEPLPYGWKNQSVKEIGKTLSLLSHPANSQLFQRKTADSCVSCAVVGNGGILNGSRQGKAIDSHDYVFRVNGAIIKGFEEDVGTKTSFYGFTTNSLRNSLAAYNTDGFLTLPRDPGIGYIFIPAETRDYVMLAAAIKGVPVPSGSDKGDRPSDIFGYNPKIHQFKMIDPSFIQYVTQRFLKSPQLEEFRDLYMPSTGALILLTALHTCDKVSAYGFITENYDDFSDHYFDQVKKPLVFYANHDMKMEGSLWKPRIADTTFKAKYQGGPKLPFRPQCTPGFDSLRLYSAGVEHLFVGYPEGDSSPRSFDQRSTLIFERAGEGMQNLKPPSLVFTCFSMAHSLIQTLVRVIFTLPFRTTSSRRRQEAL